MKVHQERLKLRHTLVILTQQLPKTFTGYQLTNTPSNATGTVTDSTQTVTYTYAPVQEKVNVQIIDDTTHQTIKTVTVNGSFGQTVSETTNDILQKKFDQCSQL